MKKDSSLFKAFAVPFILLLVFLFNIMFSAVVFAADNEDEEEINGSGGTVVVLLYHNLVYDENGFIDGDIKYDPEYSTTAEKFELDMKTMLDAGYISLSAEDYAEKNYDGEKNYFIVTFDDGYLSNYTIAFPILVENEIYASIFMCTEMTTYSNHFSWKEAQIMEESGYIKIYSHTPKHKNLTETGLKSFIYQAERSFYYLELKLKEKDIFMFAYPNGDYSKESVTELYNMGVVLQFVQSLPDEGSDWNWREMGLVKRFNIAYGSNILEVIGS